MAKELKLRRGTTAEHSTFTGAEGEVTIDTTKDTAVVHDGVTAGGIPLAKEADIPTGALASLDSVDASTIDDNSVGADELNVPGNGSSGQYLASDGDGTMTWTDLPAGGGFSNIEVFTSSGTWTNPGTVEKVKVTVVGGGGGGAAGYQNPVGSRFWGGGGGGGGAAIEIIPFPSATDVPVTIGGGGAGAASVGATGGTGGTSSFGAYCSATGGSGSNANPNNIVGSGGTGSGGNLNLRGQGSGQIESSPSIRSGSGGASLFQGGGNYRAIGLPSGAVPGIPGTNGGGGGGGVTASNGSTAPGGAGGAGVVIVEY